MLSPILLVRARYVAPFSALLTAAGAPTDSLMRNAGLDPELVADPDAVIAQAHLWKLVALAANAEGKDLGLRAALAPLHTLGYFGHSLLSSTTLSDALHRFCEGAAEEATAHFFVTEGGTQTWFCRNRVPGEEEAATQVEQYLAVLMINVVAAIVGPQWRPRHVRLQARAPSPLSGWEMLEDARVECGCDHLAIEVPTALLPAKAVQSFQGAVASRRESVGCAGGNAQAALVDLDALTSIRVLMKTAVCHGTPSVDMLASAAGVSARTLQRQLATMGTSFSREVSAARFEVATEAMLDRPNASLTALAYDLGYSDPAHFTRAFKRYAGVPPSRFLEMEEQARCSSS